MVVGLGSGSTAAFFLEALATKVRGGLHIRGVPTSNVTAQLAHSKGIQLTEIEAEDGIDIDVDGADEIDPELNVLKGGGGALLHEKIVAYASRKLVIIADETKLVSALGHRPVPVEVISFGWCATRRQILALGASCAVRGGEQSPFVTDGGNLILDVTVPESQPAFEFVEKLKALTGVVEHGVFRHAAVQAIIGNTEGSIRTLVPKLSQVDLRAEAVDSKTG